MNRLPIIATTIVALLLACSVATASPATDMKVIKKRLQIALSTGNPSNTEVEKILGDLFPNGQFDGIDYDNTAFNSGGDKRKHIANITKLAKAYNNSSGAHFKNKAIYDAIDKSLNYWVDANLQDENWWHRIIGYPKDLMVSLLLMSDEMKRFDPKLYNKCIDYQLYSWAQPKQRAQEGANGTDICKFTFATAVITGNEVLLNEVIDKANSLIRIVHGDKEEGIQPDFSFSQHTGSGRQLYLATYGREYIDGVIYFMELIKGTSFQFQPEKIDIIEQLFLNGVAWAWYKNEMDASQCGRKIVDENTGPSFVALTKRLCTLNTPRKAELGEMLNMMNGKSELTGNKVYPRHDYMLHRGKGYMTTARMTSTRTVGNEAGNGQGLENYHTGDGANYIKVKGNEYSPIYASWNWKRIPGTTIIADSRKMPQPMWGKGGEGNNDYASGASDGRNGVAAFIYSKDSLDAHKSWFFFDDYFVALGSGINSLRSDAPAVTTVNQTTLSGEVAVADASGKVAKMDAGAQDISRLWHNDVGYLFESGTGSSPFNAQIEKAAKNSILWIANDHGTATKNGTYAYAVYPNTGKEAFMAKSDANYSILSNTPEIQAIADKSTGKIMAAFYTAGTLDAGEAGTITVDKPTIMIVEKLSADKMKITVANPFCESRKQDSVHVKIKSARNIDSEIKFTDNSNSVEL